MQNICSEKSQHFWMSWEEELELAQLALSGKQASICRHIFAPPPSLVFETITFFTFFKSHSAERDFLAENDKENKIKMKYLYIEAGGPRDRMYLSQSFNPSYESVWVWVAIYDCRWAQISQFAGISVKIK